MDFLVVDQMAGLDIVDLDAVLDELEGQSEEDQVWTLTQFFFCFLFCKKIIDLPGVQINDPSSEETLFSSVPPSNSLDSA